MAPWCRALAALTLLTTGGARAGPGVSALRDDFSADPRKTYASAGEVTWVQGAVTLGPGARLSRKLPLGFVARARAVFQWPASAERGDLRLRFSGPETPALVGLRLSDGRVTLSNLGGPFRTADLGPAPKENAWEVVLELHHGLARAKAWPRGGPEPKGWLTTVYLNASDVHPVTVEVHASLNDGGILTALEVRGDPPPALSPVQRRDATRAAALQAEALEALRMGRLDEALPKMEAALKLRRAALPTDHPGIAETLNNVAAVHLARGRLQDALAFCDEGLSLRRRSLPPEHPDLAYSLGIRGHLLRDLGRLDEALAELQEALPISRAARTAVHPDVANALNNLGRMLQEMGRTAEARARYDEALAMYAQLKDPELRAEEAVCVENIASLVHALGREHTALKLFERALAMRVEALPPRHPDIGHSHVSLGAMHAHLGQHEEARREYAAALAIFEAGLPPGHPWVAQCHHNLGATLRELDRLDEAHEHLTRALALRRKALPPGHPGISATLNGLGVLATTRGHFAAGRQYYEEALALRRKALPPRHPDLVPLLLNLGALLVELGEADTGWSLLREAAAVWSSHAAALTAASGSRDHAGVTREAVVVLSPLVSAAIRGEPARGRQALELLEALHDGKAVSGRALSQRLEAVMRGQDSKAVEVWARLKEVRRQSANLLLRGPGRQCQEEYVELCGRLRDEEDRLERALAALVTDYANLRRTEVAGPEAVAARLGDGEVLIEFTRFANRGIEAKTNKPWVRGENAAVLLWRGAGGRAEARVVPLGPAAPLDQAVTAWRREVQAGAAPDDAALRRLLWQPLAAALPKNASRLVLAPDALLAQVPFGAIWDADGKYLIESYQIDYVSTGRDLLARPSPPRQVGAKAEVAVVVADPAYDAEGGGKSFGKSVPSASGLRFAPLPGARAEADAVAQLLGGRGGWEVRALRGAEASEEGLTKVARPRLLYCATHGFYLAGGVAPAGSAMLRDLEVVSPAVSALPSVRADPRLRSGLALAGANRWRERAAKELSDGLLTALEAEDLDLWGTELVVLSACETGLGELDLGEGLLGLRRAFQIAGARTVIASLWKVPDRETQRLMTDTLSRWLKGASPSDALREAQRAMIRQLRTEGPRDAARGLAPPLYWGGFVCHGR